MASDQPQNDLPDAFDRPVASDLPSGPDLPVDSDLPPDSDLPATPEASIEPVVDLDESYRQAAAARATEITRLLLELEATTEKVAQLESTVERLQDDLQRAETQVTSAEAALVDSGQAWRARELRRLRALEQRRSVKLVLRVESLMGRSSSPRSGSANGTR